jgi:hypothetical protein
MARTDIHRVGAIIPADYRPIMWFSAPSREGFYPIPAINVPEALEIYRAEGVGINPGIFACDVCGAHYKHGELWRHEATREVISVGHICAETYGLISEDGDYARRRAAEVLRARREAEAAEAAEERAAVLAANPGLAEALETGHYITEDIKARFERTGRLSGKQIALVFKLAREAAAKAAEADLPTVPAPEGRIEITGTVLGTKVKDTGFGPTLKMLVRIDTPEGAWKTWGTVPRALETAVTEAEHTAHREYSEAVCEALDIAKELRLKAGQSLPEIYEALADEAEAVWTHYRGGPELKGSTVRFTATVKRSNDDEDFSFFSRPAKAALV